MSPTVFLPDHFTKDHISFCRFISSVRGFFRDSGTAFGSSVELQIQEILSSFNRAIHITRIFSKKLGYI